MDNIINVNSGADSASMVISSDNISTGIENSVTPILTNSEHKDYNVIQEVQTSDTADSHSSAIIESPSAGGANQTEAQESSPEFSNESEIAALKSEITQLRELLNKAFQTSPNTPEMSEGERYVMSSESMTHSILEEYGLLKEESK